MLSGSLLSNLKTKERTYQITCTKQFKISNHRNTKKLWKKHRIAQFKKKFFQKTTNTTFGIVRFVQQTWKRGCVPESLFWALNTKLSILANFKEEDLIYFMSDLAI
jgi:hypothetical protein